MLAEANAATDGVNAEAPPSPQSNKNRLKKWGSVALVVLVSLVAHVIGKEAGREGVQWAMAPSQQDINTKLNEGLQQAMIEGRKDLPRKIDDAFTFVNLSAGNLRMTYFYNVSRDYELNNIDALKLTVTQRVCSSIMTKSIAKGVRYSYEYYYPAPGRRYLGGFTISSCS